MQNWLNAMQNRSHKPDRMVYLSYTLPDEFPFYTSGVYNQKDKPIEKLHIHNVFELGLCLDGSGIFVIEDKVFSYSKGDVFIISDQELHLAQSTTGTTSQWTFMLLDPIKLISPLYSDFLSLTLNKLQGPSFVNVFKKAAYPEVYQATSAAFREYMQKEEGFKHMVRCHILELFIHLTRKCPDKNNNTTSKRTVDRKRIDRISPALEYCARNYSNTIVVSELAASCHCSSSNFRRIFTEAVGCPPFEYLNRLRIKMAAAMLEDRKRQIIDISYAVGFQSITSFNRCFKKLTGMTPSQWRKKI